MARAMVTRYGMSEKLGPMTFGQKEELVFLGKEIGEQRDYSEAVAQEIDHEVRQIIQTAYRRARQVLEEHREQLDAVAQRLLEVETLEAEEFIAVLEGRPLPEKSDRGTPSPATREKAEKPSPARRGRALEMPPRPAPVR